MTMSKSLISCLGVKVSQIKAMCGLSLDSTAREERAVKAVVSDPIPSGKFLSVYKQRRQGKQLAMEYKALARNQEEYAATAALRNVLLNIKQEVVPYDHSRVLLWDLPDTLATDYHNASYIDGYNGHKEYIASQGPNTKCLVSFWHLVWQESVTCVVMATGMFENAVQQCDKYWVDQPQGHVQHGKIHVWHQRSVYLAHLNIRTFRIQKEGSTESRLLTHYEMVGFHDENPDPGLVLDVRRRVHALTATQPGPVLVHCRCGGGRTAVYIAVDYCLNQLQSEDRVDVYSTVLHLRRFRKNMVRTLSQYKQIYNTVAMFIQCGLTVYPAETLTAAFQVHYSHQCDSKHQRLEKEFQTLQSVVPRLSIGDCASGHRVENRSKSRDIMMLPPECARPYLTTADCGDSGTDFINAVYVDGYHSENCYLVTQWPMKKTTGDLWRMIFDLKISSLVVMNNFYKYSRSYPRFWPKEVNEIACYGPISVKYISFEMHSSILIRTFAIRKLMNNLIGCQLRKDEMVVKIFQVLNVGHRSSERNHHSHSNSTGFDTHTSLSNGGVAGRSGGRGQWRGIGLQSRSLLASLEHVAEWQKLSKSRQPVCIISKDGSSRVGLYCAVAVCCDQFKVDREVDVFNAVRHVRKNRPQLVPNIEEYRFIYHFMTEFITLAGSKPDIIISDLSSSVLPHLDNHRITISAALPNSIHSGVYVLPKSKGTSILPNNSELSAQTASEKQKPGDTFFNEFPSVSVTSYYQNSTVKQNGGLFASGGTVPSQLDYQNKLSSISGRYNRILPSCCGCSINCSHTDRESSPDAIPDHIQYENKYPIKKTIATGDMLTYGQILSYSTLQPLGDIHRSPSDMSIANQKSNNSKVILKQSSLSVNISTPEPVIKALSPNLFLTPERHKDTRLFNGLSTSMTCASLSPKSLCKSSSFYSCKSTLSVSSNCLGNSCFFNQTEQCEIYNNNSYNGHFGRFSPQPNHLVKDKSDHSIYKGLSSSLSASGFVHPNLNNISMCQTNNKHGHVKFIRASSISLDETVSGCSDVQDHSCVTWVEHDRQIIKTKLFYTKTDLPKVVSPLKVHSDQQLQRHTKETIRDQSIDKPTTFSNKFTTSTFNNLRQKINAFRFRRKKVKE